MKSRIFCIILILGLASLVSAEINTTKIPDEIRAQQIKDMKFGMFICWSFSTFSGEEWTRNITDPNFFRPTGCDTDQWCKTAKDAGMEYILFLTKHHDGFCLWDTKTTDFKVTNTELGIDVLAELKKSCEKYDLKLALYFSEGDWSWLEGPMPEEVQQQYEKRHNSRKEFSAWRRNTYWKTSSNPELKKQQLKELCTQYGPIEFWWVDHAQGTGGLDHEATVDWIHRFQPNSFVGFNSGEPAGRLRLRERGKPGMLGDFSASGNEKTMEDHEGYLVAEFTYPILPIHKGGAAWFYSLPKHDNFCHPPEKLFEDYLGAVKYGNIFSIDVGPNYEGRLRDIDVKTLRQVGEMIKAERVAQAENAELYKTLDETNDRFKHMEVELIEWPDELYPQLGKLKKVAFMAYPAKKPEDKLPLLIALHGGGGRKMSLQQQLARSAEVKGLGLAELAGKDLILLEPNSSEIFDPASLDVMLDYVLENVEEVDMNRVYVMGHSMGGWGTWAWINESPDRFAAAAPCGFPAADTGDVERLVNLPIWGMAGGEDGARTTGIRQLVERLREAGNKHVKHTEFAGANHSEGNAAVFSSVELVDWMLGFSNGTPGERQLRDVIVSHSDENDVLQLFRMKEDGSDSVQLTHSEMGCRMPKVSPDGKKLVYVQQTGHSLSLWLSNIDGMNPRALTKGGMNLLPSWLPDSRHIVWMKTQPGQDPSRKSQIHILDTGTGESRRLFTDPDQLKFSNSMPVVSPQGDRIAFVSDRGGVMRIWVSNIDGSNAREISRVASDLDKTLELPIEQKVPAWSPDGKWIAHWEGVEMSHLSKFTGKQDRERDRLISQTWNVWVVGNDGKNKRKIGRGDDPSWSPDGFVTRAFPDQNRGGPKIVIETDSGEKQLPIVPRKKNWGRFTWLP